MGVVEIFLNLWGQVTFQIHTVNDSEYFSHTGGPAPFANAH